MGIFNLEYSDDTAQFGVDAEKAQGILTIICNDASIIAIRFSSSKSKLFLQIWLASSPE